MKRLETIFGRVAIPLITPFTQSFEVDYGRARELAERLIERKYCDSLVVAGTNGEFHSLSHQERVSLFREIMQAVGDTIPLIAGTGASTTEEAIRLTQEAESLGYKAAMILPSYYGNPTQEELYTHFASLAAATRMPIVLYNIPIFTGVNIKPETTVRLASLDNVIGIKEEAALFPLQASEILTKLTADSDFSVYCGDDTMVLPVLAQGGSGAVSGTSHITGDLMKAQIEAFFSGRIDEAIELHHKTYRFTMSLFPGERVNPVPLTKAALALTGFDVGPPRRPLLPPSEDEAGAMKSVLKAIGKL